jgi:hypothetical protein
MPEMIALGPVVCCHRHERVPANVDWEEVLARRGYDVLWRGALGKGSRRLLTRK